MERILKTKIIIFITCLLFLMIPTIAQGADLTAQEIIDKTEANMDYGSYQGQAEMTINTSSGDKRVLKMEMWGEGTDKSIIKYYSPSRIEGVTFLFLKDDIWSYFPRTGRVRHLAAHVKNQSMMGSSFSYEDFSSEAFTDYETIIKREEKFNGEDCYLIEGEASNDKAAYQRLIAWITKEGFRTLKVNYFNDGQQVKEMLVTEYQKINGDMRPKTVVMKDLLEDKETTFSYLEIKNGVDFAPNFFHERNLERISAR